MIGIVNGCNPHVTACTTHLLGALAPFGRTIATRSFKVAGLKFTDLIPYLVLEDRSSEIRGYSSFNFEKSELPGAICTGGLGLA